MDDRGGQTSIHTLVIDTSYGSTVGVVGHEPIVETDSRTHVERLQANISRACVEAGLKPEDLDRIVVGIGPAPFTGLRAGVVAAKALAFVIGAELIGQNILEPQALWNVVRCESADSQSKNEIPHVLTLAVNDARRKQLYFALFDMSAYCDGGEPNREHLPLIAMDIDYPEHIVERVNAANIQGLTVDVIGHGAGKYESVLRNIAHVGDILDDSVLDQGSSGLHTFVAEAEFHHHHNTDRPVEPLYLRRPDAEVPKPLKHVLGHAGVNKS